MLTQRALDRAAQNIALDYKDVPIEADYVNQIKAIAGIEVKAKSKWLNALHVRGTAALINSMKSISYVERIDFANKALNQAGKIVKEAKSKAPNKTKEIKS
jgi:hypothetical protein